MATMMMMTQRQLDLYYILYRSVQSRKIEKIPFSTLPHIVHYISLFSHQVITFNFYTTNNSNNRGNLVYFNYPELYLCLRETNNKKSHFLVSASQNSLVDVVNLLESLIFGY